MYVVTIVAKSPEIEKAKEKVLSAENSLLNTFARQQMVR